MLRKLFKSFRSRPPAIRPSSGTPAVASSDLQVRSGTNSFHGNFYEYLRNDKLDAHGFFNRTRSVNRQNEFGGSLGGPVIIPKLYDGRNKTFFFLNINEFRFRCGS